MSLKNKRVLITAGPTWVPIDNVRVISNIATGETGILLANELKELGASVTLVLGPVSERKINKKVKLISFRFFDELKNIMLKEIKTGNYNVVIQTAAVSDYRPKKVYVKKIKSGINNLRLSLMPTSKIIDYVKKLDHSLFLVGFKFEPGAAKNSLIQNARRLMRRSKLDLTVANTDGNDKYCAYILKENKVSGPFLGKAQLVKNLLKEIEAHSYNTLHRVCI